MFEETRLLDCLAYGSEVGPGFNTLRIPLRSGVVRRKALQSLPLYRVNIRYQNLQPAQHQAVIDAYNATLAGVHGFRFKDHSDYQATNALLPVLGTGASQQVQLAKPYEFGSLSIYRTIRKPVVGTVTMTDDGAPLAASVDYTTGIATFTASNGGVLRWSGEFDIPVFFADDRFMHSLENRGALGLFITSDVALEEDRSA